MVRERYEEKEIDIECPKCGTRSRVKANNFFNTIYTCGNCKEIIIIKKLEAIK